MSFKSVKIDSAPKMIAFFAFVVFGLVAVWFCAKWFLGNSISTQVQDKQVAVFATGLAPSDPQTHFALAVLNERSFLPSDLPRSLAEYEKAVALSPSDFRLWLALGKAKERSGNIEGAEAALKKASELAPNYSEVQWAFGNILLRQGKNEAAFAQIRKAVERDPSLANPAATTVWQIFEGDIDKVKQTIGDSAAVNSALATFLAKQSRFDEALEIWNSLPENLVRGDLKKDSEKILNYLMRAKKYRKVLSISSKIGNNAGGIEFEKIANGGFEAEVKTDKAGPFDWQIAKGGQPQISLARGQKRNGAQSLSLNLKITKRSDFRTISQTVIVDGGEQYEFEVFYRSDLEGSGTMMWVVTDTVTRRKRIASTESLETNADWSRISATFTVPEQSEGVTISLVRSGCVSAVCPISGKVWFDDAKVRRLSE